MSTTEAVQASQEESAEEALLARIQAGELIEDMHGSDVAGADLIIDAIPGVLLLRAGMLDEDIDAAAYADEVLTTLDALAG